MVIVATPVARDESTTVIVTGVSLSTHLLVGVVTLTTRVALSIVATSLDTSELNTSIGPADAPNTVRETVSVPFSETTTGFGDSRIPGVAALTVSD
jgi:hypothetical protein